MSVEEVIARANALLPGRPVDSGSDLRWQAILAIAEYLESDPDPIWEFVRRWGGHAQKDLRDAIACALLEHLLECHFDRVFPHVGEAVRTDRLFADTFCRCWKFGQSEHADRAKRFDDVQRWCRTH